MAQALSRGTSLAALAAITRQRQKASKKSKTQQKEKSMNRISINQGAGWPSKTGEDSGKGRDNNPPRQ
jgi:hypothetical protein